MKLKIIFTGYGKKLNSSDQLEEYISRIRHYSNLEIDYINFSNPKVKEVNLQKNYEAQLINKKIQKEDYLVLLDERGQELSSKKLSSKLNQYRLQSKKSVLILIGGSYGFDESIKSKANETWSLSKLTFPHKLVRLILAEQIYRAFTIINNEPYHHE
ncbi:MAG TPA: 23S rRNA (pseudouridine(1915)-N(3))-methyltransferase RlmH [Bacteroidia bacterium]|nr:23S rRNA (pseudouridine(1915)-N(3))-methyltransferase RlmH [Bacteroidia bacterium]HNT80079.1 23S rRNA (pseudouridine(1915)-N(3))-methyltransferase RlmH [Bacteroidia bacterium]